MRFRIETLISSQGTLDYQILKKRKQFAETWVASWSTSNESKSTSIPIKDNHRSTGKNTLVTHSSPHLYTTAQRKGQYAGTKQMVFDYLHRHLWCDLLSVIYLHVRPTLHLIRNPPPMESNRCAECATCRLQVRAFLAPQIVINGTFHTVSAPTGTSRPQPHSGGVVAVKPRTCREKALEAIFKRGT